MTKDAKSLETALRRWESMLLAERSFDRQFKTLPSEAIEESVAKLMEMKRDRFALRNKVRALIESVVGSVESADSKAVLWQLHEAIIHEAGSMPSFARVFGILRSIEDNKKTPPTDHVTLQQCAALVKRSKRTLERWKTDDHEFPTPNVLGGDGKADEWLWSEIRPYLEKKSDRKLPKVFPSHVSG